MSLRARLGLLYALVFGLSLVVSDILVYLLLASTIQQQIDQGLAAQAQAIAGSAEVRAVVGAGPTQATVVLPDLDVFTSPVTFVQVVDRDGDVAARSANLGNRALPHDAATLAEPLSGKATYTTHVVNGVPLRIYQLPLQLGGRVIGVLQVARSLVDVEQALGRLRIILLGTSLAGLAVASVAGWILAGLGLRPIDRLTRAAAAIGAARAFDRRLAPPNTHDELGRLATTFNSMLAELEAAFREVEQALGAQRRFVADASHELRTPLTTIRTNLDLLERVEDLGEADRMEALADTRAEVDRLARLVGDLLTLARADAGQRLPLRPVDLAPILNEIYRQARRLALPRSQRVTLDAAASAVVAGEPDALRQLFLILVDNALTYAPEGAEVRLSLRREADIATVTVADNGPGIAAEHLPHLFERFYRADSARAPGGSGLGLAIAKWIAEAHGAGLLVMSAPGRGTTFTVQFQVQGSKVKEDESAL
jgi:signal transduction histidine kinase